MYRIGTGSAGSPVVIAVKSGDELRMRFDVIVSDTNLTVLFLCYR